MYSKVPLEISSNLHPCSKSGDLHCNYIKKSERTCNYASNGGPKNIHKLVGWTCISIAVSCMLSTYLFCKGKKNCLMKCIIVSRYNNEIAYWESILLPP